jgi:indole-3-glycerol phosphate synthase
VSVSRQAKQRGEILDEIMRYHREQLPKIMRGTPLSDLRALASIAPAPVDFAGALQREGVRLIAECKKASPSRGLMVPNYDAVRLAQQYVEAGASAISVLTDARHFQGSLDDLSNVRDMLDTLPDERKVPLLRKDFLFHEYQIYEARAAGADAVLLIAAVLGASDLRALMQLAQKLGMDALVEVHTQAELEQVLPLGPRVMGESLVRSKDPYAAARALVKAGRRS